MKTFSMFLCNRIQRDRGEIGVPYQFANKSSKKNVIAWTLTESLTACIIVLLLLQTLSYAILQSVEICLRTL